MQPIACILETRYNFQCSKCQLRWQLLINPTKIICPVCGFSSEVKPFNICLICTYKKTCPYKTKHIYECVDFDGKL